MDLYQVPLLAGAAVIVYHLSAFDDPHVDALRQVNPLTFSRQLLAAVFCLQAVTQ